MKRRTFLASVPAVAVVNKFQFENKGQSFSCSSYNWRTFFKREGKVWREDMAFDISQFAKSGFKHIEYSFTSSDEVRNLIPVLKSHNIKMPSIYVNSILHVEGETEKSINSILEIAKAAKKYGTKIIVTNPNPIDWNKELFKSDEELKHQVKALDRLGSELRKMGIKLAYHTHSTEMLAGAKEIHHMLQNTSPENVSFCFDLHWIFRGSHDSEIAVFDILKIYSNRIAELHIRQSENGVWKEAFTAQGDIDYNRVAAFLKEHNMNPHIVLEQSIENGSTEDYNAISAHQEGLAALKSCFM
ncbi:sugar phosphate isomerase/epimerase family protein [Arcticibacterium luteifluviistationis]|uniref:Xylose isomerase n=1 Tax=Arcticibacterium luteifluviistationis TaxID=1784714 RepID=A0A2Z4G811_9BACT|nr:TIM barrel protein [Arcticibacterium luteifluviistationis]AWV97218.1 xylose isomerase [Arcticibacterium luteifluviistationis]